MERWKLAAVDAAGALSTTGRRHLPQYRERMRAIVEAVEPMIRADERRTVIAEARAIYTRGPAHLLSSFETVAASLLDPEGEGAVAPPMREGGGPVSLDCRCDHKRCEGEGEYRTTFRCLNCGLEGIAVHTQGHKTGDSGNEACPRCGCSDSWGGAISFGEFVDTEEAPDAV